MRRMWRKRFSNLLWVLLVALVVAIQLWEERSEPLPEPKPAPREKAKSPPIPKPVSAYEVLSGCSLAEDRNNDGDSFKIRHDGGVHEFRLYFVDAPEKRLHQYNGERIDDQGRYFGGLDRERTIALGQAAQAFVLKLMRSEPFRIETRWRPVFDSGRHYCFVFFERDGEELSEKLVRAGLARIHTEGADLPDGRLRRDFERHLKTLEAAAKKQGVGGWQR